MKTRFQIHPEQLDAALKHRFAIGQELGSGAQGVVYAAIRKETQDGSLADDAVALKVYTDPEEDERVQREIDVMLRIRDRALASLVEYGTVKLNTGSYRYCAWEFIRGKPLDKRLGDGPVNAQTAAIIGRDLARAVSAIWNERIVHRDISPKNVMLRVGEREAVLIDLGIARHLGRGSLTAYGFTWGTPGYLSPEQCAAQRDLTCKSDIFAIGVVMQEAIVGRHPTNWDQGGLMRGGPQTAVIAPRAPAALAKIMDAMVQARPIQRPLPEQVAQALSNLIDSHVLS